MKANNGRYPRTRSANSGYVYYGKGGSAGEAATYQTVTSRPLNAYLGYTSDSEETPVTVCPLEHKSPFDWVRYNGTSYMAAARVEHGRDLDNSQLSTIRNPSAMVFATGSGAWHFSMFGQNVWSTANHGDDEYAVVFTDGHVANHAMNRGKGVSHSRDTLDFTNEP